MHRHVLVSVGVGTDVTEEIAVSDLAEGTYLLLEAPALTAGRARGDVFAVDPGTLRPEVLQRSGNLTVWLYAGAAAQDVAAFVERVVQAGGSFDGSTAGDRIFIFTVSVRVGFPVVESLFTRFVEQHLGSEWLYGNVYADDGVSPLDWWDTHL